MNAHLSAPACEKEGQEVHRTRTGRNATSQTRWGIPELGIPMNTIPETPMATNIGPQLAALSLLGSKLARRVISGLATAILWTAALNECATAAELSMQTVQGPVTLEEAIEISLANNPELAAARYSVETASADRDIAHGARLPEIHLEGAWEFDRAPRLIQPRRPGPGDTLPFTDELFAGDIVLTVPLFTGGRLKNQVIAAELITQARCQQLLYSRTELVFNVSSVFYSMLGQREVINSLIFSQKALEQHHKKVRELLDAQKAARVDLLRTEVRLADIEQRLLRERNVLRVQRYLLASLMGLSRENEPPEIEGELAIVNVSANLDEGLGTAFHNRQDYQALKTEVRLRAKEVDIARGERSPELSFDAAYGNRWAMDSSKHNEIGEAWLRLHVPLFEGGRIQAGIRKQCSRLAAQLENLRELELRIRLEVETAIANIESTHARVRVTRKAVEQGKESLRIETEKYDQGKGTIVDVLDAQSALLELQTNHYRALADCNTAIAQYQLAVGEQQ